MKSAPIAVAKASPSAIFCFLYSDGDSRGWPRSPGVSATMVAFGAFQDQLGQGRAGGQVHVADVRSDGEHCSASQGSPHFSPSAGGSGARRMVNVRVMLNPVFR